MLDKLKALSVLQKMLVTCLLFAIAFVGVPLLRSMSQPTIEVLIKRAIRADCPPKGFCDSPTIESELNYEGRHYYLVRIHLMFEAMADVISYRLVECDGLYESCTVVDKYDGEFGVVEVITDTGQLHLQWEPFAP